ncbi:MAG: membrane protein insertase YidC, partial [Magnetococcales bacterium]|nr:membrane protein insertase YidC [Magnetococcales bacterium]
MDQRTVLALTLSFVLLLLYQVYLSLYVPTPSQTSVALSGAESGAAVANKPLPEAGSVLSQSLTAPTQLAQLVPSTRRDREGQNDSQYASFSNRVMSGRISLVGAQLVELQLLQYRESLVGGAEPVQLFSTEMARFLVEEGGFLNSNNVAMPTRQSQWRVEGSSHIDNQGRLRLVWNNNTGLLFEKIYELEADSYALKIEDRISNQGTLPVSAHHYVHLLRTRPAAHEASMQSNWGFEGPMGFFRGTRSQQGSGDSRVQQDYETLLKSDAHEEAQGGWIGFSDKYFLAALVPGTEKFVRKFYFDHDAPVFRTGIVSPQQLITPGAHQSIRHTLFMGPKRLDLLKEQNMGLDRSIDYGWFHFLAEPLAQLLQFFNRFVHNYGIATILLTILVRLLVYPLTKKSSQAMNAMKQLQPEMEALKKRYADDKARLNQEVMQLYQKNGANPLAGCLPILLQLPVFVALYNVLYLSVEMRHAPFFWWIQDLSAMDPYYVLPILMGASMLIQTKLNPAPADPVQAKVFLFLPVIFTVMFLSMPSGLMLYWLVSNIIGIAQQMYLMKQLESHNNNQ